jgi:hypothetical protein
MSAAILLIIADAPEGITAAEIRPRFARKLGIDREPDRVRRIWLLFAFYTTANAALRQLVDAGYVAEERTGRTVRYRLTSAGAAAAHGREA